MNDKQPRKGRYRGRVSKAPSIPATMSKQHCRMLTSRTIPSTKSIVASTKSYVASTLLLVWTGL